MFASTNFRSCDHSLTGDRILVIDKGCRFAIFFGALQGLLAVAGGW